MALKIEWAFQFERFPSNKDKQFCYQFREFDFHDAYSPIDTMSHEARMKATPAELALFRSPPHITDRIMKARVSMANIIAQEVHDTIMQTLAQHDTIDGYPKDDKSPKSPN